MQKAIVVLFILMLGLAMSAVVLQDSDIETEEERWTQLQYTREIFADYGDYFPLEISFRSQGTLPADLQERYNYTNTVFISRYSIGFNSSSLRNVDKTVDRDLIGKEWKTIKFDDIEAKDLNGSSALKITVTLFPHNDSIGINEDVYSFTVNIAEEVDIDSVGPVTSLVFIPLLLIPVLIWWHHHLNSVYLPNITFWNMGKYTAMYPKEVLKRRLQKNN